LLGQKSNDMYDVCRLSSYTGNVVTLLTKALKATAATGKMALQRKPRPAAEIYHKNPRASNSQCTKLILFVLL
jgi:hypothetical protein